MTDYNVTISGTGEVVAAAQKMDASFVGALGKIETATQSVARDIDLVGGKSAAAFLRSANDAAGLAAAMGTGGVLGAVAALATGVSVLVDRFNEAGRAGASVVSAVAGLEKNAEAMARSQNELNESRRFGLDVIHRSSAELIETERVQRRTIALLGVEVNARKDLIKTNDAEMESARKRDFMSGVGPAGEALGLGRAAALKKSSEVALAEMRELQKRIQALQNEADATGELAHLKAVKEQLDKEQAERRAARKRAREEAEREAKAEREKERAERLRAEAQREKDEEATAQRIRDRRHRESQAELAAIESDNRVVFDLALERERLRGEAEATAANERIARIQKDVLADENASMAKKVAALQAIADIEAATIQSAHVKARAEIEAKRQAGDISDKKSESELILDRIRLTQELGVVERKRAEDVRVLSVELRKKSEAEEYARTNAIANGAALEAYGAAVMVVQPIVGAFTSQIARLGELNAENYRDMLAQAEELPAIFAKEAQAIAARIAAEAAGKAALSFMDAGREGALALAQYALGIGTGSPAAFTAAQGHIAAAGKHMLVGAGYAALAGGGAGAAVTIGLGRGEGGIVGLTREERERQEGGRSAGAPRDTSGSTSSTRLTTARGAAKSEGVTYNVYVGPGGLYMPGDDRRTRGVIADVNRRNRRDEFELMRDREVG